MQNMHILIIGELSYIRFMTKFVMLELLHSNIFSISKDGQKFLYFCYYDGIFCVCAIRIFFVDPSSIGLGVMAVTGWNTRFALKIPKLHDLYIYSLQFYLKIIAIVICILSIKLNEN